MKYLLLLLVVGVAAAETIGKPLFECRGRSNFTYTHNIRHETDCHKFYKCLGGHGFVIECPTLKGVHLVFNEKLRVCDWEGVPCGNDVTTLTPPPPPSTPSSTPTPTPTTTPKPVRYPKPDCIRDPGNGRKFPHEDCKKFWYCEQGVAREAGCREGTYFNPNTAECDWVECLRKD